MVELSVYCVIVAFMKHMIWVRSKYGRRRRVDRATHAHPSKFTSSLQTDSPIPQSHAINPAHTCATTKRFTGPRCSVRVATSTFSFGRQPCVGGVNLIVVVVCFWLWWTVDYTSTYICDVTKPPPPNHHPHPHLQPPAHGP